MFIMAALQLNLKPSYDTLKNFLCGLDKGPIIKVYNPLEEKNDYKAKWVYNLNTLMEARQELAKLQSGGIAPKDKDVTLEGAYELWKTKAISNDYSPNSLKNTQQQYNMLCQFISKDFRIKDIDESVYLDLSRKCREYGYSEETLHNLNACFRKFVKLCYKRRLIQENPLDYFDNVRTKQKDKDSYRLISKDEFDLIDAYFKNNSFYRLGENNYPKYRLLVNLLYYCGLRIGEALALTCNDFEKFDYYKKFDEDRPLRLVPSSDDTNGKHLIGMRVKITKSYLSDFKITKSPKNVKHRTIPLPPPLERLVMRAIESQKQVNGSLDDKIFTWGHSACNSAIAKACEKSGLENKYHCHEFRHTYISNLISKGVSIPIIEKVSGDTQETIFKRYLHMFENDEVVVLEALNDL